ncbi:helix-turn-helix transcriptional regulator [Nonomuraea sp. NPDC048882]|uniref:helix-turn-helix domain-containing protein n=1 Tax=Nonomuraea sp. NPDC048882 TaxID=3154347 RepID=UPI0033F9FD5C
MSPRQSARSERIKGPAYAFWERVTNAQHKRGWTQIQLQEHSGVDRTTLYRMKSAKPLADTVLALADALGIDHDEALQLAGLLTRESPPESSEPAGPVLEDEETEELLAQLPPRRRAILEQIRDAERDRVQRIRAQAEAEVSEAEKRFAELVRLEIEESDNS